MKTSSFFPFLVLLSMTLSACSGAEGDTKIATTTTAAKSEGEDPKAKTSAENPNKMDEAKQKSPEITETNLVEVKPTTAISLVANEHLKLQLTAVTARDQRSVGECAPLGAVPTRGRVDVFFSLENQEEVMQVLHLSSVEVLDAAGKDLGFSVNSSSTVMLAPAKVELQSLQSSAHSLTLNNPAGFGEASSIIVRLTFKSEGNPLLLISTPIAIEVSGSQDAGSAAPGCGTGSSAK